MTPVGMRPAGTGRGAAARHRSAWDSLVSFGVAVGFLAGLWLLMAPFALGYRTAGDDFDPRWGSVLVGFAVAVCSLVHAMAPRETPWLGPVLLLIGAWLLVVPFAGPLSGEWTAAAVSDAVTGAAVAVVGLGATARAVGRWRAAGTRPVSPPRTSKTGDHDRHTQ